jgi:hypothetical protein
VYELGKRDEGFAAGWEEAEERATGALRKNMGFPGTPVIAISSSTRLGSRGVRGAEWSLADGWLMLRRSI